MVLRTIHLTVIEAAKVIGAWIILSGFIWSVGGFIFMNVWVANRDKIVLEAGLATREDIKELKEAVADAATTFEELSRQIVILSQPENVVLYRDAPVQVGTCRPGEPCSLAIFAARDVRAAECRIIPQRTELLIISGSREYVAPAAPDRSGTNLPPSPRALEPMFILPRSLPEGTSRAVIRTFYSDCPWQNGEGQPPVMQDSPVFELTVTRRAE